MNKKLWACLGLILSIAACTPKADTEKEWNGTYIGYVHRNKQDTTLVTLVFNGQYYAGSTPQRKKVAGQYRSSGASSLRFSAQQHDVPDTGFSLNGVYQYEKAPDGSIRIWQQYGGVMEEFILRELLK